MRNLVRYQEKVLPPQFNKTLVKLDSMLQMQEARVKEEEPESRD